MVTQTRPRGREAVSTALIEASLDLFIERTPDHVTVREIAQHADVNQGLVHEYFGSKDGLILAAMEQVVGEHGGPSEGMPSDRESFLRYFALLDEHPAYVRLVTWWLLDRRRMSDISALAAESPVVLPAGDSEQTEVRVDPRLIAAAKEGIVWGWVTSAEWFRAALGLDDLTDEEIREQLTTICLGIDEWNRA